MEQDKKQTELKQGETEEAGLGNSMVIHGGYSKPGLSPEATSAQTHKCDQAVVTQSTTEEQSHNYDFILHHSREETKPQADAKLVGEAWKGRPLAGLQSQVVLPSQTAQLSRPPPLHAGIQPCDHSYSVQQHPLHPFVGIPGHEESPFMDSLSGSVNSDRTN